MMSEVKSDEYELKFLLVSIARAFHEVNYEIMAI